MGLTSALNIYGEIMAAGIKIHTTMDDRLYEPNCQMSQILATLSFNTANEESAKKSYLTNKYCLYRINQFKSGERSEYGFSFDIGVGRHPFYFELDYKVVKPNKYFKLARELVELALDGKGIETCRKYAASNGLELGHTAFARFFKSEALFGKLSVTLESKKYELNDYYPAVCSKTEFLRIAKIKSIYAEATGNRKYITLLSGMKRLYCSNGYSIIVNETKGVRYYRCGYIECKCGTHIPQYSLNRMILETLLNHVFVPVQQDNHELLDLQIELEQQTEAFKKRQRMVLEHPDLFDDEAMIKLAEDRSAIEATQEKVDAEQVKQASLSSYTNGLTLDHFNEWLSKSKECLESNDEEQIKQIRERLKAVIQRITLDNGLVKILLADNTTTVLYSPKHHDRRTRSYLKLQILDEITKQGVLSINDAMQYVAFTEQDLLDNNHVHKAEDYPGDLLKPCSKPLKQAADHKQIIIDAVNNHLQNNKCIRWRRSDLMGIGVTTTQWQEFKSSEMFKNAGVTIEEIHYKTANYVKKKALVAFKELDTESIKSLLNAHSLI
jgi:RNase P subunit RPR2